MVGEGVKLLGIVFAKNDGEVPLKTVLHSFSAVTHGVIRPHIDGPCGFFHMVNPGQVSAIASTVNNVVVRRINCDMRGFTPRCRLPIGFGDSKSIAAVIDPNSGVVLLSCIYAVREGVVCRHPVKLCRGLVVIGRPGFSTVITHLGPTIIPDNHAVSVFRRDPQIVVIPVRGVEGFEGAAAIGRAVITNIQHIHQIGVLGVCIDTGVIPGALTKLALAIDLGPGFSSIVTAVKSSFVLVFDDRPNPF